MEEYKEEAELVLGKAIQSVVFKYNAYAPIISSLQVVYDDMVPTMGVDKYARMVVNPKFLVENKAYAQGMLIHEVLHIFMGHTGDDRKKLEYTDDLQHNQIVNVAEDCAINQFIRESLPEGAITPSNLEKAIKRPLSYNQDAEYYFDEIMKSDIPRDNSGGGSGSSSSSNSETQSSLSSLVGGNSDHSGDINTQEAQDKLDKMGVKHISSEEVNDRVMDMAKEVAKGQGSQYGQLVDFAKKMLEPKVDWRPLLQAAVRNAEKKVWSMRLRSTYKRTSKRSHTVLLPKKYGNKISVTLSFDTSGSIDRDMVNQFLSEVQNCLRYSELKECALWHTSNYWYGKPEQLLKDIEKVFESGGTDEACMGIAEQHCPADLHIHFSDGWHGDKFGFKHPNKNIEIIWDGKDIKDIRKEF